MKQLIVIADMEGASGIFESNKAALYHEELFPDNKEWRNYGRKCITSDVLAVCNAAQDMGIDDILLYDMHFAGCGESNIELEKLPAIVRTFDVNNRECWWNRIRGQAAVNPYGIITVGQHARNGEPDAYFPHTIHTPPIASFYINGIHVAEIGTAVMCFSDVPYLANIGCAASHKEALELSPNVSCISVKDKAKKWEPPFDETYPLIYNETIHTLKDYSHKSAYPSQSAYLCELNLSADFCFEIPETFPFKGSFEEKTVQWETHDIEAALSLFWHVQSYFRTCKM